MVLRVDRAVPILDGIVHHPTLTAGLLAYYPLDDPNDATGNGYNGTLENAPSNVSGKLSNCYQFNGTDQDITLGTTTDLAPNYLTISCWVYIIGAAATNWQDPISRFVYDTGVPNVRGASYLMQFVYTTKTCVFLISNGAACNYVTYVKDIQSRWSHWVGTYDGSYVRQFLDGIEVGTPAALTGPMNAPAGVHTLIASRMGDFAAPPYVPDTSRLDRLNGKVDEVGIWSRAISALEFADLYHVNYGLSYS